MRNGIGVQTHLTILTIALVLAGCFSQASKGQTERSSDSPPMATASPVFHTSLPPMTADTETLLASSWEAYKQRFIQGDGRVLDREADDRSISEGQAYAMLRAVFADDPDTFAKTLEWSESNLQRKFLRLGDDRLWAWKWGQKPDGDWGILDANFASDADIDAAVALILAARRWNRPEYLSLAQTKLEDLWEFSTLEAAGQRYLLPGPESAFVPQPDLLYLNPSYLAPYAFRLFAQVDGERDWLSLVESSYQVLEESAALSRVGLPSDWVAFQTREGEFQPLVRAGNLRSQYGFDAYRVWWRVFLDAAWFGDDRATDFLETHLKHPIELWQSQGRIPAEIDRQGEPLVDYEATSQYAMLYAALSLVNPEVAAEILERKLMPSYDGGFWDNDSAYYTQNLVWFGLLPPTAIDLQLLESQ